MTKAELIERIARSRSLPPDISKKDIATILGVAFEELAAYFARAKVTRSQSPRFTFPRFGTFTKKKRSARRGVNPRTLEPIQIDACHTLDFKASRELRDAMNAKQVGNGRAAVEESVASPPAKSRAKKTSSKKRRAGAPAAGTDAARPTGRRRLTPRDEDAELDALIDDEALFQEPELPSPPMQRVADDEDSDSKARTG